MARNVRRRIANVSKQRLAVWLTLALDYVTVDPLTGRVPRWAEEAMAEMRRLGIGFGDSEQSRREDVEYAAEEEESGGDATGQEGGAEPGEAA